MKLKNKLIIMLIIVSVTAFGFIKLAASVESNTQQTVAVAELRILQANTTLKPGDIGFIKIQGRPNTVYTIDTTFIQNNKTIRVKQVRRSNINGEATFNWVVDSTTLPATHRAIISGGGETLETTHTVIQ
jgi:hypothetical protein